MYTIADLQRLVEMRHDYEKGAQLEALAAGSEWEAVINAVRGRHEAGRLALLSACREAARETRETAGQRAKAASELATGLDWYRFLLERSRDALLNVAPGVEVAASDIAYRERLIAQVFPLAPSQLPRLGMGPRSQRLKAVVNALDTEPFASALGPQPQARAAIEAAISAVQHLQREIDEDRESVRALNVAREAADRQASVWLSLVTAVLLDRDLSSRLGEFVLARNAAYAARRNARSSVTEEAAAQDVIDEVGAPPDDAPADAPSAE